MKTPWLSTLLFMSLAISLDGQMIDDFETGSLSNWAILQGNAETVNAPAFGAFSARLHKPDLPPDAQSLILHNSFSDNWGVYEMQCFANGSVSDVQFLFQYLDGNNYYAISCNPQTTDNPELLLYKLVNGSFQTLSSIPPIFRLNEWFSLRIERYCDGTLRVFINNQMQIDLVDQDLRQPGTIALGAWGESSYFDELTFTSVRDVQITEIQEDICSGTFFEVGTNRYNKSGEYLDTFPAFGGCDSIVSLDLTVQPHFLVTTFDTICADTFYKFGLDTLIESGRYNLTLKSSFGCDSLVELNLLVFGGDTIVEEIILCVGDFTIFNGDTLHTPGSYYRTVTAEAGCSDVIQLDLFVDQPNLDLGPDIIVCFNETPIVRKELPSFDNVTWSDGTIGEVLVISEPGSYWVNADIGSCMVSDTFIVLEECTIDTVNKYFIPNGFTPNGDGKNDSFKVESSTNLPNFSLQIFNRWGALIFDADRPWDGTIDGESQPPDVYLYVIEIDGKRSVGSVTLLR